jgi:biopolymer transport protein ExbB/TolQ
MPLKMLLGEIASVLFLPVMAALLLLGVWMLLQIGMVLRSFIQRMRGTLAARTRYIAAMNRATETSSDTQRDLCLEEIVQQAERESLALLSRVRFAVRVGPSLGLMGTLIPMSAALNGLAHGDLPGLASNMVIAFSSTVVGIAIGVCAYAIAMIRESWMRADLDAIRSHAERTLRAAEAA